MNIHPTHFHELHWVPQAPKPDLSRAEIPSGDIFLSIDHRKTSAITSHLQSDELFFSQLFCTGMKSAVNLGTQACQSTEPDLYSLGEKGTPALQIQTTCMQGLFSPTCSQVQDYRVHTGTATATRYEITLIPNLQPLLFYTTKKRKPQEIAFPFWMKQLLRSLTPQAGSQTSFMWLRMPPSTNISLLMAPAVGRDGISAKKQSKWTTQLCSDTQPQVFTLLSALFWLMLQEIEGAFSCLW